MNIKKRQKLRPRRFNLYNLLVASMKKDAKKAMIEAAKNQYIDACNMKIEQGKLSSLDEIVAYQKLLISGSVIIEY